MNETVPPKPTVQLDGVWLMDGQREELDDELALQRSGQTSQNAKEPPYHGTFTKFCYHRVVMQPGHPLQPKNADPDPLERDRWRLRNEEMMAPEPIANCILDIFDENGEFGHFVWDSRIHWGNADDEVGAWRFVDQPVSIDVSKPGHPYLPKGDKATLLPSLTLTNASDGQYPRNGMAIGSPYPLPSNYPSPASRPEQYIHYDPGSKQLVWTRPDLNMHVCFTQHVDATPPGQDTWSNLFVNSIPQWYFALTGWNPAKLKNPVYGDAIDDSGTQQVVKQGAQSTHNVPIFAVPASESKDYVVDFVAQHQKVYLPRGTRLDYHPTEVSSSRAQEISSQVELINSWSMTLGISAGIEKVLSVGATGTYGEKTKQQFERENSRTVTRRVKIDYRYFTDMMDLKLAPQFKNSILDRLHRLNVGNDPDWKDFVDNYGTHYVHAITFGQSDFAETLYSMEARAFAWEKHFKLEENAEAALDGIKFGMKASTEQNWGQNLKDKVTSKDVTHVIVGGAGQPAAIFLDLRPSWELFSPIFFTPNLTKDASPDTGVAPFVWSKVKASFRNYVETQLNVNQPLPPSCYVSHKPRMFKVKFTEFKIWTPKDTPWMYGVVNLIPNHPVKEVEQHTWWVEHKESKEMPNGSDLPGIADVSLSCAMSQADFDAGASYRLFFNLVYWDPFFKPNMQNDVTFQFGAGNQLFEWHGDNGWGHKIRIELEGS